MAAGLKEDPWLLKTAQGTSEYSMYKDPQANPPALVCQVGSTTLRYHLRAVEDLHVEKCRSRGRIRFAAVQQVVQRAELVGRPDGRRIGHDVPQVAREWTATRPGESTSSSRVSGSRRAFLIGHYRLEHRGPGSVPRDAGSPTMT